MKPNSFVKTFGATLCLLILCGLQAAQADTAWEARHGLTAAQYQATFTDLANQGYRLTYVNGYSVNNQDRYAAIWEKRPGPDWQARHGLTSAQYQAVFNDLGAQGYRLVQVSGYALNNEERYAAIWEKRAGPDWQARHGLTAAQYQATFTDLANQGYRLKQISGYGVGSGERYAAIWEKSSGPLQEARHALTAAQYQATFTDLAAQGYRLVQVSGYVVGNQERYAGIWEKRVGSDWQARHGLTAAQYQATFTNLTSQGYKLTSVSGYGLNGQDYYAALWEKGTDPIVALPVTGRAVPELAIFDQVMQQFMLERQIPAGTLAIMKEGNLLFARGYGWQDQARTTLLPPDALLRLASVVKPITAAAIKHLIAEGKLNADDRAFCLPGSPSNCVLSITPFGTADANAKTITIQHLLDHAGGWNRAVSGDPMFQSLTIANQLGIATPPGEQDIVRYMLGQPLDFVPGSTTAYSNFGYLVLGLVIEQITGQSYTAYIQQTIFRPLCVSAREIELGHSLPNARNPREPWYADPSLETSVFAPPALVAAPDGSFYLEAMAAHGGLIASGPAMAKFLQAYWISGELRTGNGQDWYFFGSLPGTHTLARQRADGVNIVALFNQRTDGSGLSYDPIKELLDAAADSIATWPIPATPQALSCTFAPQSLLVDEAGAVLETDDAKTTVVFPPNAVATTLTISYTPQLLTVDGDLHDIGHNFTLNAVDQNGAPVTTFAQPITIVSHLDADLGTIDKASLQLYWQQGDTWVTDGITTSARDATTITSTTTHLSTFALLGKVQTVKAENTLYLPLVVQ